MAKDKANKLPTMWAMSAHLRVQFSDQTATLRAFRFLRQPFVGRAIVERHVALRRHDFPCQQLNLTPNAVYGLII